MDTQQGLEGDERALFLLCMLSYSLNIQACIICAIKIKRRCIV